VTDRTQAITGLSGDEPGIIRLRRAKGTAAESRRHDGGKKIPLRGLFRRMKGVPWNSLVATGFECLNRRANQEPARPPR